jgi:glucan 1,3-beta-glucosidase
VVSSLNDPDLSASCSGVSGNCADAWGLRILNSQNILIYGAGIYSFFDGYSTCEYLQPEPRKFAFSVKYTDRQLQLLLTACSTFAAGESCQSRIVSLEGNISNVNLYNLNTIGSQSMLNRDGNELAYYADNENVFPSCIAVFKSEGETAAATELAPGELR